MKTKRNFETRIKKKSQAGFSLVEAVVSMALLMVIFAAVMAGLLSVKSLERAARHHSQAMNVVRGTIENLKGTAFNSIGNFAAVQSYDAGPDAVFGTADDFTGNLVLTVQDFVDFDNDGDTGESWIDVNNDGINETAARPIRVSFQWNEYLFGQQQNRIVSVDTLIAR